MEYRTRKMVTPRDLNANGTLFGGRALEWIDEEAAIFAACQLDSTRIVTKTMSTVDFASSASVGDIVEIGTEVVRVGRTSITLKCVVRNKMTGAAITAVDEIVFVHMGEDGRPAPHALYLRDHPEETAGA